MSESINNKQVRGRTLQPNAVLLPTTVFKGRQSTESTKALCGQILTLLRNPLECEEGGDGDNNAHENTW
jgi:hypothetical protein